MFNAFLTSHSWGSIRQLQSLSGDLDRIALQAQAC